MTQCAGHNCTNQLVGPYQLRWCSLKCKNSVRRKPRGWPPYQDDHGTWRCGAKGTSGKPCKLPTGPEPPHRCYTHGGMSPQVLDLKHRDKTEAKARMLIPDGIEIHGDPITRLLELAAECDAFRGSLSELVNKLKEREIRYTAGAGEQLRAEIQLYERALERATRAYLDVCKLNLEERLVRVRESEARALAAALDKALAEVGVEPHVARQVKQGTARHLRAVA